MEGLMLIDYVNIYRLFMGCFFIHLVENNLSHATDRARILMHNCRSYMYHDLRCWLYNQ